MIKKLIESIKKFICNIFGVKKDIFQKPRVVRIKILIESPDDENFFIFFEDTASAAPYENSSFKIKYFFEGQQHFCANNLNLSQADPKVLYRDYSRAQLGDLAEAANQEVEVSVYNNSTCNSQGYDFTSNNVGLEVIG